MEVTIDISDALRVKFTEEAVYFYIGFGATVTSARLTHREFQKFSDLPLCHIASTFQVLKIEQED